MRSEEEIRQRIESIRAEKKFVCKSVRSRYNRIIEQLRWVLEED